MLIKSFPSGPWATNCYIIAQESNSECLIIDPGFESIPEIHKLCSQFNLHPVATLLTHGHMDHVLSVVPLCSGHNISSFIHPKDEWMLSTPEKAYSKSSWQELINLNGSVPKFLPDNLQFLKNRMELELAGIKFKCHHTPGHTEGSTVFSFNQILFSGDVLFKKGIGRTDLAGGDSVAMNESLKNVILKFPDEMSVYPGHGPSTTIGDERKTNPYLQDL